MYEVLFPPPQLHIIIDEMTPINAFHQTIERLTGGSSVLIESTVLKSLLLTAASASLTTLSNIFLSRDLPWYWNSSTERSLQEPSVPNAHRCASMLSSQPAVSGRGKQLTSEEKPLFIRPNAHKHSPVCLSRCPSSSQKYVRTTKADRIEFRD